MTYIVYKRFRGKGLGGMFNLPYGTRVERRGDFLFAPDGRRICAATSENGWCHFRPDTPEGERRQRMLDDLYRYYERGDGDAGVDLAPEKFPFAQNLYWKNLLRTMPTATLTALYRARIGAKEDDNVQSNV